MKKIIHAGALLGIVALSGCSLNQMVKASKEQQLTVTPNPLEVHADTVNFEMAANLPVKMLKKGKVYNLNTYYKYGEADLELETIEFKAEDYPNASTEAPRQSKSFSFAYDPAMKSGNVEIKGVAVNPKNNKNKETERLAVADGIITTSKLVEDVYYAAYAGHGYNNQEELVPTNIDFFFDQGRSTLKYSEKRSDRGQEFSAFIAEKNVTRTVTVTGTHSPEGAERINSKLSEERAQKIEKFYRDQMKKYDYQGMADSIKFVIKPVIEDWNDFKKLLAGYEGIDQAAKSEYLNIVNGGGTFEEKEKQLRKLSTYKKVFKELYPTLRAAKTEILTVKEKKTDAEISVLAKQISEGKVSADTLSEEELMYAGTLTPSLSEKAAIYEAATKKSGSWNAHNNLAAVYIAQAIEGNNTELAAKAETQLDIANNKKESAEAYANLASVYLMQGNAYKANTAANKSLSLGASNDVSKGVNGVKGSTEIVMAKYSDAVSSTSAAEESVVNLFNKGLAQLLNKDFQNAANTFGEAANLDSNYAMAYYGAAVASARLNQADAVVENIGKAVAANPELKAEALADLEFRNFVANEAFKAALK